MVMQKQLYRTIAIVLFGVAVVIFLSGVLMAQEDQTQSTPKQIVSELMNAMQENDAERIHAVFADNASQAYGSGRPKSGEAFRAWLDSDIIRPHGRVENPVLSAEENEVVVKGQYLNNNGYTSAANLLMKVDGGKIASWTMRY